MRQRSDANCNDAAAVFRRSGRGAAVESALAGAGVLRARSRAGRERPRLQRLLYRRSAGGNVQCLGRGMRPVGVREPGWPRLLSDRICARDAPRDGAARSRNADAAGAVVARGRRVGACPGGPPQRGRLLDAGASLRQGTGNRDSPACSRT